MAQKEVVPAGQGCEANRFARAQAAAAVLAVPAVPADRQNLRYRVQQDDVGLFLEPPLTAK